MLRMHMRICELISEFKCEPKTAKSNTRHCQYFHIYGTSFILHLYNMINIDVVQFTIEQ